MTGLSGKAALVGIGATEFSKESGRSELRLSVEAVIAALADAHIAPAEVDGLVTFENETSPETDIARTVGMGELTFFARLPYGGGGACGTVGLAAMAVATGQAKTVVVYRGINERSGRRFGAPLTDSRATPDANGVHWGWYVPFGLATSAAWVAMVARRYMYEYGATTDDFGRAAIQFRDYAATNPNAWYYGKPITLDDHRASQWVAEPLRRLDCCMETDGAVAIVITAADRAADRAQRPAYVSAAAWGAGVDQEEMTSFYRPDIADLPEVTVAARQLWHQSGRRPEDVDCAVLYDHFTPYILLQLEAFGFCPRGEAGAFIADGHLGPQGSLPTNMHGGQIGEAYVHGLNGIAEAVRQIRGTAVNQIAHANTVLASSATGVATSALLLAADPA